MAAGTLVLRQPCESPSDGSAAEGESAGDVSVHDLDVGVTDSRGRILGVTCPDCGRDRRAPLTRVCLWCFDLNLLAGGFHPGGWLERWTAEEKAELEAAALGERHRRMLSQEQRRAERAAQKKLAPAQGALV